MEGELSKTPEGRRRLEAAKERIDAWTAQRGEELQEAGPRAEGEEGVDGSDAPPLFLRVGQGGNLSQRAGPAAPEATTATPEGLSPAEDGSPTVVAPSMQTGNVPVPEAATAAPEGMSPEEDGAMAEVTLDAPQKNMDVDALAKVVEACRPDRDLCAEVVRLDREILVLVTQLGGNA